MDTERRRWLKSVFIFLFGVLWTLTLSACAGQPATPTFYLPPTPVNAPLPATQTPPGYIPALPTPACADNLKYLEDITIPDGTIVAPGSVLDKQWRVQNNGTCNWDERYRLRLISGDALGAAPEQALYPARAGTQAVIRLLFTAPLEAGEYISEWQAINPQDQAFGETVFIEIIVE